MADLSSRGRVLVTGAARGLGLETVLTLAGRGFRVWAGLRDAGGAALVEDAARRRRVEVEIVALDVTDRGSIEAALRQIVAEAGGVDAVVNNAGVTAAGYFEDLTDGDIRRVFDVNLFGAMNVTRGVLPLMRAAGRGRVVMMSSICGRLGSLAVTPYVTSKFALEGWSESLSMEVAPFGIQVVIVEPGLIATDLFGRNRGVVPRAQDTRSPYYESFRRAEREVDALVRASRITPADVALGVHRALTATTPRLRYVVGRRARLLLTLQRHLPGELFQTMYGRMIARRMAPSEGANLSADLSAEARSAEAEARSAKAEDPSRHTLKGVRSARSLRQAQDRAYKDPSRRPANVGGSR